MRTSAKAHLEFVRENALTLRNSCEALWHPLGFVSCVLKGTPSDVVVRLHYWPHDERRPKKPDWPIHTHVYDLSSFIIDGRVRDIQYRAKEGREYSVFSVSYVQKGSSVDPSKAMMSLDVSTDEYHSVGQEYFIPVGTFHQTLVPEGQSAITLVVQSNFQKSRPLVLGNATEDAEPYSRETYDKEQFWTKIEAGLSRLKC